MPASKLFLLIQKRRYPVQKSPYLKTFYSRFGKFTFYKPPYGYKLESACKTTQHTYIPELF